MEYLLALIFETTVPFQALRIRRAGSALRF